MKQNVEISPEEKLTIKLNARRMVMSFLCLLFVIYAFITFSVAWYSTSSHVNAKALGLSVADVTSKEYNIYEWDNNASVWKQVQEFNVNRMVPNQTTRFMITADATFSKLKISLYSVDTPAGNNANENIYDYLYCKNITAFNEKKNETLGTVAVDFLASGSITQQDKLSSQIDNNDFKIDSGISDCHSIVFDVYISKDVCNYFASWQISSRLAIE